MTEYSECDEIMCDLGLDTKEKARAWLIKNHADKGGKVDPVLLEKVTRCYSGRKFCATAEASSRAASSRAASSRAASSRAASSRAASSRADSSEQGKKLTQAGWLNQRKKIYTCMRQTENWSKMLPEHKFDNKHFDPNQVEAAIHNASPKLEQLFQIIEQVDANDMATHGKYFKHFIFSDVKEQGYGAKILASAFIAKGYKNLIAARAAPGQKALKMTLLQAGAEGRDKSFGLLSSSAIFGTDYTQKFKKEVLQMYNKRPENIQGADMRFIILDSGFKEGIDLFDVKYTHIFEPSMTIADLKQTIGRATRTCGQKGLNFEPNVGWPLYVYNYYIAVPEEFKDMYKASDPRLLETPDEDTYIFKNTDKFKDAALLYSEFDRTMTKLAEQLYQLAPIFSVDFSLTSNIHRLHDATYLYDVTMQGQNQLLLEHGKVSGGAAKSLKDIEKIKCPGKCGLRSTNDIPATVNFLLKVYLKYKHNRNKLPPKKIRAYLCAYMKQNPDYCAQVNAEWANRAAMVPSLVSQRMQNKTSSAKENQYMTLGVNEDEDEDEGEGEEEDEGEEEAKHFNKTSYLDIGSDTDPDYIDLSAREEPEYMSLGNQSATPYLEIEASSKKSNKSKKLRTTAKKTTVKAKKTTMKKSKSAKLKSAKLKSATKPKSTPKSASTIKIANEVMQQLDLVPYVNPVDVTDYAITNYGGHTNPKLKLKAIGPPPKKLNFTQMRDFIKTNYKANFTWGEMVIENKCIDKPAAAAAAKVGGASRIMNLNPTQDFVRTFFTPQSPYKGLLLFHSVGTGKCHALDTPILMYDGSVKMVQDIVMGDQLMGDDSKPRTVLSLARGQDTLYDIIPVKGEKYTVNSEHILCLKFSGSGTISNLEKRQKNLPYKASHIDNKTVTLKSKSFATRVEAEQYLNQFTEEDRIVEIEVKDYLKLSKNIKRELKGYRKGVEFTHKELDVDPYIIGLWLGNGSNRGPAMSSRDGTTQTTALIDCLNKYNLIDNKHIPYDYKCNNRENRLKLLAGLIDTNGSYSSADKCYEITQQSDTMVKDILFLIRSLGFAAYSKKCNRIHFSGVGMEEIPVQLTRKMEGLRRQKKDALNTAIRVEKAVECGDYYGFTLNGNCRYLLGDFTVTHNTCSAIATATSTFEKEGYTILWVTRNTLKIDVYKNMFDDVCHIILAERMQKKGMTMPDDPAQRKRLLSKNWIEPISYKTFSNLLTPGAHNIYMDKLIERNGKADILKKTLIIIDEAHKLYGGDLKASERPNMDVMERLLQKSYDVSGKDSAKLLIMTATPFTNSPMELFKLVNLCKEVPAEHINTDIKEFKRAYMNSENILTETGVKKLADQLSGYISYLNREQDPTQFAQPIMIEVPTIMSHIPDQELRESFFAATAESKDKKADKGAAKQQENHLKELNKRLRETQKNMKTILKERQGRCKTIKNKGEKARCMEEIREEIDEEIGKTVNAIRDELERLKSEQKENKDLKQAERARLVQMKEKLDLLQKSLLQEVMLKERCKNITM